MTPEARRDRAAILLRGGVAPAHSGVLDASKFIISFSPISKLPMTCVVRRMNPMVNVRVNCVVRVPFTVTPKSGRQERGCRPDAIWESCIGRASLPPSGR